MEFHIYTKDVKIGDTTYTIRPLTGRYLPKLYNAVSEMASEDGKVKTEALSEKNMADLHLLAFETFKKSYPQEDETTLDEFVSQNLLGIIGPMVEVNMSIEQNAKSE